LHADFSRIAPIAGRVDKVDLPIVPERPRGCLKAHCDRGLNDMNPNPAPTVTKSDDEWKKQLTPEQFHVARQHGTERPFSSPLNREKRPGLFKCVCCGASLFSSSTKFDSGTGWPSFWAPVDNGAVREHEERSWLMRRTEVRCASCDVHLGHVFPDGPKPTGARYCMNGVVLSFAPNETSER
jgi:peptide-methionine (R)-S-oxide reductase